MADHVNLPLTGSGDSTATVAAEDIGGVHYQFFKQISAADGSTAAATLVSTTVDSNLTSAGSTKLIGLVDGIAFSSGNAIRTTVNSSVDVAFLAANAARRAVVITNGSTGTALLVSFTTAAVSSAAAYTFQIPALGYATIGGQLGNVPLYTGPIRGKMNSTLVAGPVYVTEFT
jgi:hypothetical protein